MVLEPGKIIEGKVTGITQFGAFVTMENGKTGLIHISEVATEYVKDIKDHLKEGDTVKAKIISIDKTGKISLSVKQAILDERAAGRKASPKKTSRKPDDFDWGKKSSAPTSFEEMMAKFKQDSDEKLQDVKKSFDSKRGSGYKRSSGSY
ncbi:MAG: S1 RNA-binding domain-containing protein [Clostridia bacterium]|nr:S1 RNA-binding domain-containing protein [Clostridia bacterium]